MQGCSGVYYATYHSRLRDYWHATSVIMYYYDRYRKVTVCRQKKLTDYF
jgi:hypothetical protein